MNLTSAAAFALILRFAISVLIATWNLAPWLAKRPRAEALTWLLWTQVFRYVALQIFSAQHFGFSNAGRDAREIATPLEATSPRRGPDLS
jgi:hypothetical protein